MDDRKRSPDRPRSYSEDSDGGEGGGYCFEFPVGGQTPRGEDGSPGGAAKPSPNNGGGDGGVAERKFEGVDVEKYHRKLLHWGGGLEYETEEDEGEGSEVENGGGGGAEGGGGWRTAEEREDFNRYLADLLEKEDYDR